MLYAFRPCCASRTSVVLVVLAALAFDSSSRASDPGCTDTQNVSHTKRWDGTDWTVIGKWCNRECKACQIHGSDTKYCVTGVKRRADSAPNTIEPDCRCVRNKVLYFEKGAGRLTTQDPFIDFNSVMTYQADDPNVPSVLVRDCDGALVEAEILQMDLTFAFATDPNGPPDNQPAARLIGLDVAIGPVTVCGQNWGITNVTLDPAEQTVGIIDYPGGGILMPIVGFGLFDNDVFPPGSELTISILGTLNLATSEAYLLTLFDIPVCDGDLNSDNHIDLTDLSILLVNFGQTGVGFRTGDLNGDNVVNLTDLSLLLVRFGQTCS